MTTEVGKVFDVPEHADEPIIEAYREFALRVGLREHPDATEVVADRLRDLNNRVVMVAYMAIYEESE